MKLLFSFCFLIAFTIAPTWAQMETNSDEFDGTIFSDLSKEAATAKAGTMAERDFVGNNYRILVAGKRPQNSASDNLLKAKYGVTVTSIAGCVVTDGIIGAINGYNSTIKPLLNRKFGHDIFQEADEAR
jgi:hypothetical protein